MLLFNRFLYVYHRVNNGKHPLQDGTQSTQSTPRISDSWSDVDVGDVSALAEVGSIQWSM